jgi:pyruvate/2-oxoglutarate dehydrogenase complex dihydrolipoamide dehydrogenase (E3) component
MLPYVVFTDPQLGRVGLSEKAAREKGVQIKIARMPTKSVARAIETGQTKGLMKVIIDKNTSQILGASILGAEGGEIMSMIQIAMMGKLTYTQLGDAIIAHPTFAESLNVLFQKVG